MLLIQGWIVYHGAFVDGAVVFDRVGQSSEFSLCQHLYLYLLLTNRSISMYIYYIYIIYMYDI